jgi:uncharacterized protein DUF4209
MNKECLPSEIELTLDDFMNSDWKIYIEKEESNSYNDLCYGFSKAAQESKEAENFRKEKVFGLLSTACSMKLRPKSHNEPFNKYGARGTLPQDFNKSELSFFESILLEIDDFMIKARLADILWLVKQPRKYEFALTAIDNYILFPLGSHDLPRDGNNVWKRAIDLSLQLGEVAKDKLNTILERLFHEFENAKYSDEFHALWLARLLFSIGLSYEKIVSISKKLEKFGTKAIEEKDWWMARHYLEEAITCLKSIEQDNEAYRIRVMMAESWVTEANNRQSQMAKGDFLENAINIYRQIPKTERSKFNVDRRLEEIRIQMSKANCPSLEEMHRIKSPSIDLRDIIEESRKCMQGKPYPFVLCDFSSIATFYDFDQSQKIAEENIRNFPLQSLFPSTKFSSEGRVVDRRAGLDLSNPDSPGNYKILYEQMLEDYFSSLEFVVKSRILPALDVLNLEHYITYDDLVILCNESTFVPQDRVHIWAKGLLAGIEKDYMISSHLLIPQLEHYVRIQLKNCGENTSTIDSNGIENESGLSTLMENPKIDEIFGKSLSFEFKALLTNHGGPNLRNELAHGLSNVSTMKSCYTIYFWWLCFRLVIISIPWMKPVDEIVQEKK